MSIYLKNNTKDQEKIELALRNKGYGGNKKGKTWFDASWIGFKQVLQDGSNLTELNRNLKKINVMIKENQEAREYIIKRIEEEKNQKTEEKKGPQLSGAVLSKLSEAKGMAIAGKNIAVQQHWYGEAQAVGFKGSFDKFMELIK